MQTFLPVPSFAGSAQSLDRQRLGKQRVEVLQILNALAGQSKGWTNHPATRMWRGHERALIRYGLAVCDEWIKRGYNDSCRDKILAHEQTYRHQSADMPPWMGDDNLHRSHQSNLKRKNPDHYAFPVPDDLPYVWPIEQSKGGEA
jgi:hypothetical protein